MSSTSQHTYVLLWHSSLSASLALPDHSLQRLMWPASFAQEDITLYRIALGVCFQGICINLYQYLTIGRCKLAMVLVPREYPIIATSHTRRCFYRHSWYTLINNRTILGYDWRVTHLEGTWHRALVLTLDIPIMRRTDSLVL